ncbi:DUF975 family protein [Cohnella fermenti]|uniref:DUF975 family protein n=1 Tax=Cohnella fermenti TaxID=2565925 RepID=A0A4S4C4P3_9BACL|nr:DUF975 family protein [Cohnella fermenti]THF82755.1 DUF975 family protein [Cohnella fermenti]
MTSSYSELRYKARQSLKGNWGKAVGAMLILFVIEAVIGGLNEVSTFGNVISLLVGGALTLGVVTFFLELARAENPSVKRIFSGFPQFWKAFLLNLLIAIFTILWMLLLVIPGIIAAYRYSQAYYILKDNPEIAPLEAIRRSKELMAGKKGKLFVLHLTFIGWALLCIITLGIGYLWLAPYVIVTQAHFYDEISGRTPEPPAPVEYQFTSFTS